MFSYVSTFWYKHVKPLKWETPIQFGSVSSGSIGRSDGPIGSNELSRSQEGLTSKITSGDGPKSIGVKTQPQLEQLQAQFAQHMNEHKQQVKDLKRQIDQLKVRNFDVRNR